MIDTCQANTMYTKFYSPNIIATGSSEIDQSSYSHHADNDVGVAVIDRYTYYNLDFLETHIREPGSKMTLGDLFDSYDESKIHSHPGVRYDLFPGGEAVGRERLVMDFFGNVQNVEVEEGHGGNNGMEWKDDLVQLGKVIGARMVANKTAIGGNVRVIDHLLRAEKGPTKKKVKAFKIKAPDGWMTRAAGALALAGCVSVWFLGSRYESRRR